MLEPLFKFFRGAARTLSRRYKLYNAQICLGHVPMEAYETPTTIVLSRFRDTYGSNTYLQSTKAPEIPLSFDACYFIGTFSNAHEMTEIYLLFY